MDYMKYRKSEVPVYYFRPTKDMREEIFTNTYLLTQLHLSPTQSSHLLTKKVTNYIKLILMNTINYA
jgi:hypothetical protein